ncbi:MAG: D-ribose pyranase [Anaerolineae bacterium]
MKKIGLLNQPLSNVIAGMGHLDTLVIADAGLPIPMQTPRIDLAIHEGMPPFLDVVRTVLGELQVQEAVVAAELEQRSSAMYQALRDVLGDIPVRAVPHTEFKAQTSGARAIVRTGEFTPYANVILIAGVVF